MVGSMQEGDIFLLVATLMSEREGGGVAMRVLREREECCGYGNRICACVCVYLQGRWGKDILPSLDII